MMKNDKHIIHQLNSTYSLRNLLIRHHESETPWWCQRSNVFHGVRHVGFKRNICQFTTCFKKTQQNSFQTLKKTSEQYELLWRGLSVSINRKIYKCFLILLFGFFTIQTGNFSNQFWSRGMFSTLFLRWKEVQANHWETIDSNLITLPKNDGWSQNCRSFQFP